MGLLDAFTKRRAKRRSAYLSVLLHCGHEEPLGVERLASVAQGRKMVLCHSCGLMREAMSAKIMMVEE